MAVFLWALAIVLVLVTVLPVSRLPHGAIRIFSFGRQQVIIVALAGVALAAGFGQPGPALVILAVLVWQVVYIGRYLPTGRVQSLKADPAQCDATDQHLTILAANVKLSNRAYDRLAALVRAERPNLLILLEPDADWLTGLASLHGLFPHRTERPLDTGYGMALWSDRELVDLEWRELLVAGVPSIKVRLSLADEDIRLYVLHPEPPLPTHDTMGRDAEIGLVGIEAAQDDLPAIVTGDLNDVAWSHTTRRFQRLSGQLDPRVGRGFYNTFHAQIPLLRWPLDHLFHDPRFRLVRMARLPAFGSDHFAMLFTLALAERVAAGDAPDPARPEDREDIREMAAEEQSRDRRPLGEDWEKD